MTSGYYAHNFNSKTSTTNPDEAKETNTVCHVFSLSDLNISKDKYKSIVNLMPNKKYTIKSRMYSRLINNVSRQFCTTADGRNRFKDNLTKTLINKVGYFPNNFNTASKNDNKSDKRLSRTAFNFTDLAKLKQEKKMNNFSEFYSFFKNYDSCQNSRKPIELDRLSKFNKNLLSLKSLCLEATKKSLS